MKKLLLLYLFSLNSFSQIPSYYNGIDLNQSGQALENDLGQLISSTHINSLPYTSSSTDTWDAVIQTDLDPNDNSLVLLFYGYDDLDGNSETDYTRDKTLSCHATPCTGLWTREHVFARSLATPTLTTDYPGSGTDVHNLRACDGDMNTTRSNRLFEDGNGTAHITGTGEWYPGDEWKGDVARIIMYMHLRYPSQCPANDIGLGGNTYDADMPDVFLDWNVEDPVSDYEMQRNPILEAMQGNRNPFIDNPYLATKIWGGNDAVDTWGLLSVVDSDLTNVKVYPTIVHDRLYISNTTNRDIDIVIYNVWGQEMIVLLDGNKIEIGQLDNGFYFLKINENAKYKIFKFIKD